MIKYILSLDENLFYFDDEGNVLYTACLRDDINTFEYLFNKYYVDINQKSKNRGNTFLMKTTYYDNIEVFKYLINHGADINIISDEGMTVYDYAVKNKSEKILEYLSKIDN